MAALKRTRDSMMAAFQKMLVTPHFKIKYVSFNTTPLASFPGLIKNTYKVFWVGFLFYLLTMAEKNEILPSLRTQEDGHRAMPPIKVTSLFEVLLLTHSSFFPSQSTGQCLETPVDQLPSPAWLSGILGRLMKMIYSITGAHKRFDSDSQFSKLWF